MLIPQMLGISLVIFILIRLIPGDPVNIMLGPLVSESAREELRIKMGLMEPLPTQYLIYVKNLFKGDWGTSITTGRPVIEDLTVRLPATLELITFGLFGAVFLGVIIGLYTAFNSGGLVDRGTRLYSLAAGAIPDFWLALILIYFLYYSLGWLPAPVGRIGFLIESPNHITGFYTIDSLLTLNFNAFFSSVSHLILPVLSLTLVWSGLVIRMTRSILDEILESEFIIHAKANGLPKKIIWKYAFRNASPPIMTIIAVVYGFLLGGAVLIEQVFSWNGIGQYAVLTIARADYAAIQGFVLIASIFTLLLYVFLDILYSIIDPRIHFE